MSKMGRPIQSKTVKKEMFLLLQRYIVERFPKIYQ